MAAFLLFERNERTTFHSQHARAKHTKQRRNEPLETGVKQSLPWVFELSL